MSLPLPARVVHSLLLAIAICAAAVLPASAGAAVTPLRADLEGGSLTEFSQWHDQGGSLTIDSTRAYSGARSGRAHYPGGTDNAFQRGIWNLKWAEGEEVWYSAAIYLPAGFKKNMRGQVDLLRWDNWEGHPNDTDWGGLVIWNSDKKLRLMRFNMAGDGETLVGPLEIPEGRWVHFEIHQRLSSGAGGVSELYVDGQLVGASSKRNMYGRSIDRLRVGVVAIGPPQTEPLTVWFDRVAVDTKRVGALGGPATQPVENQPVDKPATCPCADPAPVPTATAAATPVAVTPIAAAPTPGPAAAPAPHKAKAKVATARKSAAQTKTCPRTLLRRTKIVFRRNGRRVVRYRTVRVRSTLARSLPTSAKCRRKL